MHTPLRQQALDQLLAIITAARPLLEDIHRRDRDLASQLKRAINSIGLNLAEGFGSQAGNARLRFLSAHGSLHEAQAALQLATAWGYLDPQRTAPVAAALDHLGARLYGLSRR
jgi:four helix bundle protein